MTTATPDDVALVIELLDDDSKLDVDTSVTEDIASYTGERLIAWAGSPDERSPIAIACIERDDGRYGTHARMMTTRLLCEFRMHRQLLRVMRAILGREVCVRGYAHGGCGRAAQIVRMLDMLGAEFAVKNADDAQVFWCLRDNPKLRRTI